MASNHAFSPIGLVIEMSTVGKATAVAPRAESRSPETMRSLEVMIICWERNVDGAPTQNPNTLGAVDAMF